MKRLLILLLCATTVFAQSGGQPAIIPVQNQAFEIGYGQSVSQDLGVTPATLQNLAPYTFTDGVYQLNFVVQSHFTAYPGYWSVQVDFGTQELCSTDGWGTAAHTQINLTCPGPGYIVADQALPSAGPVQSAHDLVVNFSVPGWPIKFSNVSMTFIPQP